MTEKLNSTSIQENNKPTNQNSRADFFSHQLLFDSENINQLEETLKTMTAKSESLNADDTLEDSEEQEISLEISSSDEEENEIEKEK